MGYSNSYGLSGYSSLQDSIASLCKNLLPFNTKKSLPNADHKLLKLQSDNLKWQQDSFHQIMNLMGLHQEGIARETDVSAFRSHLLDTLIAAPPQHEQPVILRDKLLFLQELLYAKCISVDEYHSSKRPLLQRMAVQGAEIEARAVIVGRSDELKRKENAEGGGEEEVEEWSVIDLRDEKCLLKKDNKSKQASALKKIKEASSAFSFVSPYRIGKGIKEKSIFETASAKDSVIHFEENPPCNGNFQGRESELSSILMAESSSNEEKGKRRAFRALFHGNFPGKESESSSILMAESSSNGEKGKRTPFRALFPRDGHGGLRNQTQDRNKNKCKGKETEDETSPLRINGRSDEGEAYWHPISNKNYEMVKNKSQWTTFEDNENYHPNLFDRHHHRSNPFLIDTAKKNKSQWTTFEDNENYHPNLFDRHHHRSNPFLIDTAKKNEEQIHAENPFWTPSIIVFSGLLK